MKLHFTAVEASGDLLAGETIDAVRSLSPDTEIVGIGLEQMAARGVTTDFDTSQLAIFGIIDALMAYRRVVKLARAAADEIIAAAPDVAVLVDSWGFTLRVAQRVRARAPHIRLVKLVGPQVWATRPGRARRLAQVFDQVLCLLALELAFYEQLDVRADLIGVPALSRAPRADGDSFRRARGIAPDVPVLLILPGSRASEIRRVAPTLLDAAALVARKRPDVHIMAAPSPGIANAYEALRADRNMSVDTIADPEDRFAAMASADVALVCSGTVTSEVAAQETAMVVAYKVGGLTYLIARHLLYRHDTVTLLNIAAGDIPVAPEFLQDAMAPEPLGAAALGLLENDSARTAQVAAQSDALGLLGMGGPPAAQRAAEAILDGASQSARRVGQKFARRANRRNNIAGP